MYNEIQLTKKMDLNNCKIKNKILFNQLMNIFHQL